MSVMSCRNSQEVTKHWLKCRTMCLNSCVLQSENTPKQRWAFVCWHSCVCEGMHAVYTSHFPKLLKHKHLKACRFFCSICPCVSLWASVSLWNSCVCSGTKWRLAVCTSEKRNPSSRWNRHWEKMLNQWKYFTLRISQNLFTAAALYLT